MTLTTLLDHLSSDHKENLLRTILAHSFERTGAKIDPDAKPAEGIHTLLKTKVTEAIAIATQNLNELALVDAAEDELLDDEIHTAFEDQASNINNGGADEQARYLIVEAGWKHAQVNQSLAAEKENFSEIPR